MDCTSLALARSKRQCSAAQPSRRWRSRAMSEGPALQPSRARTARGVPWLVLGAAAIVTAALILVRPISPAVPRPSHQAQLKNWEDLFQRPPSRSDNGQRYVYTPSADDTLSFDAAPAASGGDSGSANGSRAPSADGAYNDLDAAPPRGVFVPQQDSLETGASESAVLPNECDMRAPCVVGSTRPLPFVRWAQRPTASRIEALYPRRAQRRSVG